MLLVGDSLGMVTLGYESTLPVTLDEILHHTRAVRRGTKRALLVAICRSAAFTFRSTSPFRTRIRLVKEAGAEAVKIEGGERRLELISRLVEAEIPVMGHVGLTPQSINALAAFTCRARRPMRQATLERDAHAVEAAGAFSVVSNPFRAISPPKSRASFASRRSASAQARIATAGPRLPRSSGPNNGPQAEIRAAVRKSFSGNHARCHRVLQRRTNGSFPSDAEFHYHSPAELRQQLLARQRT